MERVTSRRGLLRTVAGAAGVAAAGCVSFGNSGEIDHERVRWQRTVDEPPGLALAPGGGTLYAASRWTTYALAAGDGSERWAVEHGDPSDRYSSAVGSEVVTDGDRLYLPGRDGVVALAADGGAREWTAGPAKTDAVALADGTAYANGAGEAVALDAASGAVDWRAPAGEGRLTTPAVGGDAVVVTDRRATAIHCYGLDGGERWSRSVGVDELRSPAVADGVAYVAGATDPGVAGRVLALDLATGESRWERSTAAPERGTRPVVDGDSLYLGASDDESGLLVALAREDGRERWHHRADDDGTGQPAVGKRGVYVGSNDDTLYALSRNGEKRFSVGAKYPISGVTVGEDTVYANMHSRVFAVDST